MAVFYRVSLVLLFLASIVASNYAVSELAPVQVWPGVFAPAGVYLIACTLAARDFVQRFVGPLGTFAACVGGLLLSYALASSAVASASAVAFVVSFAIDTAIFTVMMSKTKSFWLAVLVSGLVSLIPDTLVFCYMAGFPEFIPGQLLGKLYATVAYALMVFLCPPDSEPRIPGRHRV